MATRKAFKFKLGEKVALPSREGGVVEGRAHYINSNPQYLVKYIAADGRFVSAWHDEDDLKTRETL